MPKRAPKRSIVHAALGDEPAGVRVLLLALAEAVTADAVSAGAARDQIDAAQAAIIADARALVASCRTKVEAEGERP